MEFDPLSDWKLHLVETAKTQELGAAGAMQWIVSTDVGDIIGIFEGTGEEDREEYGGPDDKSNYGGPAKTALQDFWSAATFSHH